MIFHNRPKFRGINFVFRQYSERIRCALHYMHGLLQTNFHPGRRWRVCCQNYAHYGTTVTTCQWMPTVHYGAQSAISQLLVPKAGRERLFLPYHASLYGGHLGRTRTLARLADRFYWSGMSDDVKDWLGQCVACIKRKSPVGCCSRCPECNRLIKINMGCHIRLMHTTYVCFWKCPVMSCSLWFTLELNATDHIEGVHKLQEGHGTSFYECLRQYGIESFGSRTFFETRRQTTQAIWMDLALSRRSGQELRNLYIVTKSPEHAPLWRFFKAAVDQLQILFDASLVTSVQPKSFLAQMREAVADCDDASEDGSLMLLSPPRDIPEAELPAGSSMEMETRDVDSPVVITRRVTPANRDLQHLEASRLGASTPQHVMSRPAVPDLCIANSNLLSLLDSLPMDRLSRHTVAAISSWPEMDRHNILAVANRDVRVARQNLAELQLYVDDHAAHLANCASADDDNIALMSAELLPRLEGGIRAAIDEVDTL